jgi:hypothetical protein
MEQKFIEPFLRIAGAMDRVGINMGRRKDGHAENHPMPVLL